MRGVYGVYEGGERLAEGSSPHARGLPGGTVHARKICWIIPACAGFTPPFRVRHFGFQDHPRMRGVYGDDGEVRDVAYGSSPHARGLRVGVREPAETGRIIPACAGFTPCHCRYIPLCRDHPRMRGVYSRSARPPSATRGSSPHARGLPAMYEWCGKGVRIIPACAGFTLRL